MKKHVRIYMKAMGIGEQDNPTCEVTLCCDIAVDVHHILFKSQGGKDEIDNLIGLCREHHDIAHGKIRGKALSKDTLRRLTGNRRIEP